MQNSQHTISGICVNVAETGAGAPLLLVHGLGGSQMWERAAPILGKYFHVIVPDLPGFGESDPPPDGFSSGDYAKLLHDLLINLRITTTNIAGISYGGEVAAHVAFLYPACVDRLLLIAGTGFTNGNWFARNDIRWLISSLAVKHTFLRSELWISFAGRRSFYDIRRRPPDLAANFYQQISRYGRREAWLNCARNIASPKRDFVRRLASIASPTLILWGEDDRVVPAALGSKFQQCIPGSKLRLFPQCGHSLPLEKPVELCEELKKFVYSTPLNAD